jgi:hypothetical protein
MDQQIVFDALLSLIPPAMVGVLFYVVMRGIFRADSKERKVYAKMEAEMRAEQAETVKKTPKTAAKATPKVSKATKK